MVSSNQLNSNESQPDPNESRVVVGQLSKSKIFSILNALFPRASNESENNNINENTIDPSKYKLDFIDTKVAKYPTVQDWPYYPLFKRVSISGTLQTKYVICKKCCDDDKNNLCIISYDANKKGKPTTPLKKHGVSVHRMYLGDDCNQTVSHASENIKIENITF